MTGPVDDTPNDVVRGDGPLNELEADRISAGGVHWWAIGFGLVLILGAIASFLAGPIGYRTGAFDFAQARELSSTLGGGLAVAGGVCALVGIVLSVLRKSSKGAILGVVVLMCCLLAGFRVIGFKLQLDSLPPLYDAQTDWSQPIAFSEKALDVREAEGAVPIRDDAVVGEDGGSWAGKSFAQAQSELFTELRGLNVGLPVDRATVIAAEVAEKQGWTVMLRNPPGGQVEAVYRSTWYGVVSDVAIRVRDNDKGGSLIDLRSTGRLAEPDLGANATLIKVFIDDMATAAHQVTKIEGL